MCLSLCPLTSLPYLGNIAGLIRPVKLTDGNTTETNTFLISALFSLLRYPKTTNTGNAGRAGGRIAGDSLLCQFMHTKTETESVRDNQGYAEELMEPIPMFLMPFSTIVGGDCRYA